MEWTSALELPMEGRGFALAELGTPYDRLPKRAEGVVREPVWNLSQDSAGMVVSFLCTSPEIHARWTLRKENLAMAHMPATGVSGLDLYVNTADGWRWLAVGVPQALDSAVALCSGLPAGKHEFMLYLPLYNGVHSLDIGVPAGAGAISAAPPRPAHHQAPIAFYGTSITQGGCASRPGMAYTAIVGRRLDRPVVNLGFSGNGRMEPEVADLHVGLSPVPCVFVIDCLPNMNGEAVAASAPALVRTIRAAHPAVPILLVEDRIYASVHSGLMPGQAEANRTNREALRHAYEALQEEGVAGLHYLEAGVQLSTDGEDTVDGSHPTDLGFMRQADAFEAALLPLVAGPSAHL